MAFNAKQLDALENCILNQIPEYMRRANIDRSGLGDLLSELQKIVKEPGNVLYENFDDGVDLTRKGRILWVKALRDYQFREVMKPTGKTSSTEAVTKTAMTYERRYRDIVTFTKEGKREVKRQYIQAKDDPEFFKSFQIPGAQMQQATGAPPKETTTTTGRTRAELIAAADANQKALADGTLKGSVENMMEPIFELLASGEMSYAEMRQRYG